MIIQELLDYTRKHVLRDKSVPPLWPDERVLQYLNEGQQRTAVRTHAFVNSTREVALLVEAQSLAQMATALFNNIHLQSSMGVNDSRTVSVQA